MAAKRKTKKGKSKSKSKKSKSKSKPKKKYIPKEDIEDIEEDFDEDIDEGLEGYEEVPIVKESDIPAVPIAQQNWLGIPYIEERMQSGLYNTINGKSIEKDYDEIIDELQSEKKKYDDYATWQIDVDLRNKRLTWKLIPNSHEEVFGLGERGKKEISKSLDVIKELKIKDKVKELKKKPTYKKLSKTELIKKATEQLKRKK